MKIKRLLYLPAILILMVFVAACSGDGANNANQDSGTQKMSGAEILEDAKTYADQQCTFNRREISLKNKPKIKDFDLKMQELKRDRKKAKNYYLKKYNGFPEERVAFQRSVKAARQQPDYCKN